jgi:hypothetical protein
MRKFRSIGSLKGSLGGLVYALIAAEEIVRDGKCNIYTWSKIGFEW